jgi:hypothetical protein
VEWYRDKATGTNFARPGCLLIALRAALVLTRPGDVFEASIVNS